MKEILNLSTNFWIYFWNKWHTKKQTYTSLQNVVMDMFSNRYISTYCNLNTILWSTLLFQETYFASQISFGKDRHSFRCIFFLSSFLESCFSEDPRHIQSLLRLTDSSVCKSRNCLNENRLELWWSKFVNIREIKTSYIYIYIY